MYIYTEYNTHYLHICAFIKHVQGKLAYLKLINFEAKDRTSRGQGPRTQTQVFSKKKVFQNFFQAISKKGLQNFFQAKNVFKNFFSGDLYLRRPKKRSLQIFRKVSGVFQRNFNGSKIVLSSSRGRAIFEELRVRGQGLQNVSSRTPPQLISFLPYRFVSHEINNFCSKNRFFQNLNLWKYLKLKIPTSYTVIIFQFKRYYLLQIVKRYR